MGPPFAYIWGRSHTFLPLFWHLFLFPNSFLPLSPRCLIRSIGRPEHPAAFPFFVLSMAFLTSSLDISWTGPSTTGTCPSCSLAFSTFNRLLKYSLYLSLIFTSSINFSPVWSLITFTSPMYLLDLALCFATL